MKFKVKKGLIFFFVLGLLVFIVSNFLANDSKTRKLSSLNKEEVQTETKSSKLYLDEDIKLEKDPEKLDQIGSAEPQIESVQSEKFIYETFNPLSEKLTIPLIILQSNANDFFSKLIQIDSIYSALRQMEGHGYVSFDVEQISKYYPEFIEKFFSNLTIYRLPDFFWTEVAGNGVIYFKNKELQLGLQEDLKQLNLDPKFISFEDPETLKIDLSFAGYKISIQQSKELNLFLSKYPSYLNTAQVSATGNIAIMLTSLRYLSPNLVTITKELYVKNKLAEFLSSLKVDGILVLDLRTLKLYQSELGNVLDIEKLKSSAMLLQKTPEGQYVQKLDFKNIVKHQDQNLAAQDKLQKAQDVKVTFYSTFIDLPFAVSGSKLIKFIQKIIDIEQNFFGQKLFTPGTKVTVGLKFPLDKLGESLEPTFIEVLKKIHADRIIQYSLENVDGEGSFYLPVNLNEEQFSSLNFVFDTSAKLIEKFNPRLISKIYVEFLPTPEINELLDTPKYNILSKEIFDGKTRVLLTSNEKVKIDLLKELAITLAPEHDLKVGGFIDIDVALFSTDRHANSLLEHLMRIGSIDMEAILKGIKGTGAISLYPDLRLLFDQQLNSEIQTLFKNNQAAFERWKLLQADFRFRVPEDFKGEAEKGSLRDAYHYIHKDNKPKNIKARADSLVQIFQQNTSDDLTVPEDLGEILDILSDKRKISDVLKDKHE